MSGFLVQGHLIALPSKEATNIKRRVQFVIKKHALSSIQNQVNATYRINSRVRAGFGVMKSLDPDNWREGGRNRLTVRFNALAKIDGFRINNTLRAEWNSPERSKYEYRIRYAFRIYNRKWKLPLKARPFINNEFQYYLSGKLLWYRDETGERVIQQSPDGLHAHRVTLGVRFRLMKRTYMTVSCMKQTEFNLGNEYRRINVEDPRNGRIRRRFNNFSVFNFNVSHRLKF